MKWCEIDGCEGKLFLFDSIDFCGLNLFVGKMLMVFYVCGVMFYGLDLEGV